MCRLLLSSAFVVGLLIAGTVSARTAPPISPNDPRNGRGATSSETPSVGSANADQCGAAVAAANPGTGLGDIIVTAQLREESLRRAAVSVNVARGADLIAAGITEPYRLSELSPGLTIQPTGTGNLIFVRGR